MLLVLVAGLAVAPMGCSGGGGSSPPPPSPAGVEAASQDGAVVLTWEGTADATGYNVYRTTASASGVSGAPLNGDAPVGQTAYTDETAENGTRYYYRVTAVGDGGESGPSSEVSARPFSTPPDRP
jgi:fibronectin type 3 domain-containing protein